MLSRWLIVARCYTFKGQGGTFAFATLAFLFAGFIREMSAADSQPDKSPRFELASRLTDEGLLGGLPFTIPLQLVNTVSPQVILLLTLTTNEPPTPAPTGIRI